MTTLPKNLESIRDELAKKQMDVCYCSGPTCSGCEYSTEKLVKLAFEVGANEVLKVANKLDGHTKQKTRPE